MIETIIVLSLVGLMIVIAEYTANRVFGENPKKIF
jgi:hypothetical protein